MNILKYIPFLIVLTISFFGCSQQEFSEFGVKLKIQNKNFSKFSQIINQKGEAKIVDILIVVDNSTSMASDQEKLSREFSSFVSSISDADYRIGVITTDTDTVNKENTEGFYGNLALVSATGKKFIEKSDPNPDALFAELIKREETLSCIKSNGRLKPNCVSFSERPLFAIKMAMDKRTTVNSGFFREGADLGVVIITDEDETDFSDGTYYSAQNLLADFATEFGNTKKIVSFNIAIQEGDVACYQSQASETISGRAAGYGLRTGELAVLTGGFSLDICDENFSLGLSLISEYVKKNLVPLEVQLPESIILDSIVIRITTLSGENFDPVYEIKNNILKISPLPPEGSLIELEYDFLNP